MGPHPLQVKGILEEYRIGRLKGGAAAPVADPYANEPQRLPALIVRSQKPMNSGGRLQRRVRAGCAGSRGTGLVAPLPGPRRRAQRGHRIPV